MKYTPIFLLSLVLLACTQQTYNTLALQKRIDSLEKKLNEVYKPGFGECMSNIQAHHSKLWFAGQNQNWKLADFEIHEILEAVEDIEKYQTERKESKSIGMLLPAIDSVNNAIQQKNTALFKNSYTLLTNTCNSCHQAVEFEFNVVKIPETSPFSNQDFRLNEPK